MSSLIGGITVEDGRKFKELVEVFETESEVDAALEAEDPDELKELN